MTRIDASTAARLVVIGPLHAGKTTLIKLFADLSPTFVPIEPLAVGNGIAETTGQAALHRVPVDPADFQYGLACGSTMPVRSLDDWIAAMRNNAAATNQDPLESLYDLFDGCGRPFTLMPMPQDATAEASSKRLVLEMIDTPGINNATRSADPIHERNLTEILAKMRDVGGVSAIVLVVRYATPLSRNYLDSTFANYLSRLTVHCKNLIVVHSHYFPQLALERGLPYLDLSDRIAAFNDWLRQTAFGHDVTATHLAMNNKHVPRSESYPAQEAFLFQQADAFLQTVMRYVDAEPDTEIGQANHSVEDDLPPELRQHSKPTRRRTVSTELLCLSSRLPLSPVHVSLKTHDGWYLSAINKNNFFQCRNLKKQYDIACGVFNMTWERWQFRPVDGGRWTVRSRTRNTFLTARATDGYLDQVAPVIKDEQRFRILIVSDAPGQIALMTSTGAFATGDVPTNDRMWVGAKAMTEYSVHARFEVLQDAMPLMWFPFIGGTVHVRHGSSGLIVQMSLQETVIARPAAITAPHDVMAQWVLWPHPQVSGAFLIVSRADNAWIAALPELALAPVAEDAAPIWVVLVDVPGPDLCQWYPEGLSPSTIELLSQYLAQYGKSCPNLTLLSTDYNPHVVFMSGDKYLDVSKRLDKITADLNRPDLPIVALPVATTMPLAGRAARIAFYYQQRVALVDLLSKYSRDAAPTAELARIEMGQNVKMWLSSVLVGVETIRKGLAATKTLLADAACAHAQAGAAAQQQGADQAV
ncbi:hypothetical protein AMAG_10609 [Allomyces macrogynus ATCC 38327]|uniref:Uncharacterized protein n=1 Tax=Allomyces macrogynus (strain ATCC 38327) TaxID=578462 RepID=A0A0L0SRF9_ALLM3|nr:hypothetical protein AMAG_10609 [Allomyces macrogynus ATCC 38327]|eukprot:KNE64944.1 hypothetical protein AMAG_10609 [Allomyces macrogynus ATCC 38327]